MAKKDERGTIVLSHGLEVKAWKPEDPRLAAFFPDVGQDLNAFRWGRLFYYVKQRDGLCWVRSPDHGHGLYMHEAIRRSAVMGWAKPLRVLIHAPFNCVLLCGKHHGTDREPSVEDVASYMFKTYGLQYLDWLKSLPFLPGSHPLKGFLQYHGVDLAQRT